MTKAVTGGQGVAAAPLVFERTVQWADSDPAGQINAPRAFDYAAEAIEGFFRLKLGISFLQLIQDLGLGAPYVHASCDYFARLPEGQDLRLALSVERIGRSSITWQVHAVKADTGESAFRVRMISSVVSMETRRAVPIPSNFRDALETLLAPA